MQLIKTARGGITTHHGEDAGRSRRHVGIDIGHGNSTAADLRMVAPAAGRVIAAGWDGTYGLRVIIEHPDGSRSLVAHMDRLAVGVGYNVDQGSDIGVMGRTGGPWGSIAGWFVHGHQEYHVGGIAVDPLAYMGEGTPQTGTPITRKQADPMTIYQAPSPSGNPHIGDGWMYVQGVDGPLRAVDNSEGSAIEARGDFIAKWHGNDIWSLITRVGLREYEPLRGDLRMQNGTPVMGPGKLTGRIIYG